MSSAALLRDPRLYMKIAGSLLARIEDGTCKPGDQLPTLGRLAGTFEVSRQTAQHAMQVLAGEGLVCFVPGRGYYVCEPS